MRGPFIWLPVLVFTSNTAARTSSLAPVWPANSVVTVSEIGGFTVRLRWSAAHSGVARYQLLQGNRPLQVLPASVRQWTVTGLKPDTAYTFKVEAGSHTGEWTRDGPSASVRTSLPIRIPRWGVRLLSHGQWLEFSAPFAGNPVVITSAHSMTRTVRSAAANVTPGGFLLYLTEDRGTPVTDAWVQWVAVPADPDREVQGGVARVGYGQAIAFPKMMSTTPVVVTNAYADGKAAIGGAGSIDSRGFRVYPIDDSGSSLHQAWVSWLAVVPRTDSNGFRGGTIYLGNSKQVSFRPPFDAWPAFVLSAAPLAIAGAVDNRLDGFTLSLYWAEWRRLGQPIVEPGDVKRNPTQWLGYAGGLCGAASEPYQKHLCRIREAGVPFVRLEVGGETETARYARSIGLEVIAIVKTQEALANHGFYCQHFWPEPALPGLPGCVGGWAKIWERFVESSVQELSPHGVRWWQIDNELNHPILHSSYPEPTVNLKLAADIVRIGAQAVKRIDPAATTTANLIHCPKVNLLPSLVGIDASSFILAYRGLVDVLGLDYYKGSWCLGTPAEYVVDIPSHHTLWGGDVMIMETGFCTEPPGSVTEGWQSDHVSLVFASLARFRSTPWFRGIVWYFYKDAPQASVCDRYFGLHRAGGLAPDQKAGWKAFTTNTEQSAAHYSILGITYHR